MNESFCFSCGRLIVFILLWCATGAQGSVVPITSIQDIAGTTIDFELPGATANSILPGFDMLAIPDVSLITLIPAVTGNSSAPIRDRALFSAPILIETTGAPWVQIGITGAGTIFGKTRSLTLSAFDESGAEIGTITRLFAPAGSDIEAYNAAAVFLGLGSSTPIQTIILTSDDPNVAWDDLTFVSVPEPATSLLFGSSLAGMILWCGLRSTVPARKVGYVVRENESSNRFGAVPKRADRSHKRTLGRIAGPVSLS